MTIRPRRCWHATAGVRSKKCSSMWPAAAARSARQRNENRGHAAGTAPGGRHGVALLVFVALVLATAAGTDLLARGANADVGLPTALYRRECQLLRARQRHLHWGGAALGYPV